MYVSGTTCSVMYAPDLSLSVTLSLIIRYPKHYWPDDPSNAEPTKMTKKKMDQVAAAAATAATASGSNNSGSQGNSGKKKKK